MPNHSIEKRRLDTKRRQLTVTSIHQVTPHLLSIEFACDDFADFTSPSPDDHIKVFLPLPHGESAGRDFTPRAFDAAMGKLVLEFALHESGPASGWARSALPGSQLEIGGPRGTTIVSDDFDWYLLIGDTAALPSFARRLEVLRPDVPVDAFIAVHGSDDQLNFETLTSLQTRWFESEAILLDAAKRHPLPAGDGFIWVATETARSRELYQHFTGALGHPSEWIKASGYWTRTSEDAAAQQA